MTDNFKILEDLKVLSQYGFCGEDIIKYNAYLGVSFSKKRYFSKRMMSRYVRWICSHFNDLLIIIADHLEIYNKQVFDRCPFELAKEKTLRTGQDWSRGYKKAIPHELIDRVTVCLASEVLSEHHCKSVVGFVKQVLNVKQQFRSDIQSTILQTLIRKMRGMNFTESETEVALDILQNYLIEEIAIILYLTCKADKRYDVSIFPYPPPEVLIKLYEGAYAGAFLEMTRGRPYKAIELVHEERL